MKYGHGVSPAAAASMDRFASEVLRWNTQFSLISRTEPEKELRRLLAECTDGFSPLWEFLPEFFPPLIPSSSEAFGFRYLDLGSGGGFPGLPWSILAAERLGELGVRGEWSSHLVEPRRKRAWFLERCLRLAGLAERSDVHESRWGEVSDSGRETTAPARPVLWLVTLKALRLGDADVLDGLSYFTGNAKLTENDYLAVCRFHSGRGAEMAADIDMLGLPAIGDAVPDLPGASACHSLSFETGGRPRSLLLSLYRGDSNPA